MLWGNVKDSDTQTQIIIPTLSVSPGHGVEPAAPLSGPQLQ